MLKKGKNDNDLSLCCPHYYDGPIRFHPNRIYIASSDQLPSDFVADAPCLLITPELHSKAYNKNIFIVTVEGASVVSLFNQVMTIFDRYTEWDETLQNLVFHNAPLEEYLKCSYPFIGNAMNVHFTDFFDLKYCYHQAEFTLHAMNLTQSGQALHHFKHHTLEHFLQFGCSVFPARLICADCIKKLAEHDETTAVSYCESLRIYLDTGMNTTETARRLNVKRNTFLARLERILRYVDLDLENEDDRLYLQISLRLI